MFYHSHSRLHLVDMVGKISLAEVTLTEDPSEEDRIDEGEQLGLFMINARLFFLVTLPFFNSKLLMLILPIQLFKDLL